MFNRSGFNQTEFNTTSNTDIYLYGTLSGTSALSAEFNVLFTLSTTMPGDSSLTGKVYRRIVLSGSMSADGTITAKVMRLIRFDSDMYAEGSIEAHPTHMRLERIEFMADFNPGDVIVINSKKKTVTINGQNASHLTEGFMKLLAGANTIEYSDAETLRNVQLRIEYRDKLLY